MRARKRSQASRILTDLRLIDSAIDQYAIENNKKSNDPVGVGDWTAYVKKGSPLFNTGRSIFGTTYGSQTVDQLPQGPSGEYNCLMWLGQAFGHLTDRKVRTGLSLHSYPAPSLARSCLPVRSGIGPIGTIRLGLIFSCVI